MPTFRPFYFLFAEIKMFGIDIKFYLSVQLKFLFDNFYE